VNTRATPQTEVILRLRSAAGHLNAVIEMAEDGRCCEDVLHQLRAVEAALHHAGGRLLCSQIEQSEALILQNASPARRAAELKRLVSLYSILMHGSNRRPEETK
jgi:DNA-binding FrmR family transcriptional regulator